jgi:hypothetical protein
MTTDSRRLASASSSLLVPWLAVLAACGGNAPLLGDRDAGTDAPIGADDAQVGDAGRGDAGPPPIDSGPECLHRDPIAPEDPARGTWDTRFGNPGVGGDLPNVEAFAFGTDGRVYVGGDFTSVGLQPARNIAWWDGETGWHPVGDGLPGRVTSIAIAPDGTLWAAHAIDASEYFATRISRLEGGTSWTTVADIEGESADDYLESVEELAFVGTTLFAVGSFSRIGGVALEHVARFDGATWSGYAGLVPDNTVTAISATSLDDVCIGGGFQTLGVIPARFAACWNGSAWQARSFPLEYYQGVFDLVRRPTDGALIAGGDFMMEEPSERGGSIAVWTGSAWELIGGGVMTELGPGTTRAVRGIVFAPHGMYAGGAFNLVNPSDPILANGAARWNGTAWEDFGGLFKEAGGFSLDSTNVNAIGVAPDGSVYFGGLFTRAGSARVAHVARFDGTYWSALRTPDEVYEGVGGRVWALTREGACAIYVGGEFEYVGGVRANGVARYTRSGGYEALGDGVLGAVTDLASASDGVVYAVGAFVDGDTGTEFRNVAVWNGSDWEALGPSVDGPVWAVALEESESPDEPDRVYVAGEFGMAGEVPARRIAMWAAGSWTDLGAGLEGFPFEYDPTMSSEPVLYDVLVDPTNGDVIIAGSFRAIGEGDARVVANNVARWDGERWHAYGDGLTDMYFGSVLALTFHEGRLVAGGSFGAPDAAVQRIAIWNGTAWEAVGTGGPTGSSIAALESIGGALYAGGAFQLGGEDAHIAVYDDAGWHDLNAGLSDIAEALVVTDEGVYIGGPFNRAGEIASVGLALWQFER